MNAQDYRQVVVDRWRLLVAGLVAGLLLATLVVVVAPTRYSSQVGVILVAPTASRDPDQRYQADVLARERAGYYVPLVTQPRLAADVAARTGVEVDAVIGNLAATTPPNTPLVFITATDTSPDRARAVADAAGVGLTALVGDIEAAAPTPSGPQVVAAGVQPATPAEQVSLGPVIQLALGALVGVLAGLGIALVRQARDPSVRSVSELRTETRLPVLAAVGTDRRRDRSTRRRTRPRPSHRVETARRLRAGLDLAGPAQPPRAVVLAGLRGGERTSTTVLDLADATARAGRSVVVVECDLRQPQLAAALDLDAGPGLLGVLRGEIEPARALRRDPSGAFDVLPCAEVPDAPPELLDSPALTDLLETLGRSHHTVLVTVPPVLAVIDAAVVGARAGGVVLVVMRGRTSTDDLQEALRNLRSRTEVLGTVLTGARVAVGPYPGRRDSRWGRLLRDRRLAPRGAGTSAGGTAAVEEATGPPAATTPAPPVVARAGADRPGPGAPASGPTGSDAPTVELPALTRSSVATGSQGTPDDTVRSTGSNGHADGRGDDRTRRRNGHDRADRAPDGHERGRTDGPVNEAGGPVADGNGPVDADGDREPTVTVPEAVTGGRTGQPGPPLRTDAADGRAAAARLDPGTTELAPRPGSTAPRDEEPRGG